VALELGQEREVCRWEHADEVVTEAVLVLKWGGVLTEAGRRQAEALGRRFRETIYEGESLLRLHSTYRHDCKVYAASEGRVQMTAAAFAKGLLALDGSLTPILASLVRTYNTKQLLDDASPAKDLMNQAKARLRSGLVRSWTGEKLHEGTEGIGGLPIGLVETISAARSSSTVRALRILGADPLDHLKELHRAIEALVLDAKEAVHRALQAEVAAGDDRAVQLLEDFEMIGISFQNGAQREGGAGVVADGSDQSPPMHAVVPGSTPDTFSPASSVREIHVMKPGRDAAANQMLPNVADHTYAISPGMADQGYPSTPTVALFGNHDRARVDHGDHAVTTYDEQVQGRGSMSASLGSP